MYKGIKKNLEKFVFCPKVLSFFVENTRRYPLRRHKLLDFSKRMVCSTLPTKLPSNSFNKVDSVAVTCSIFWNDFSLENPASPM
jgi:hypothetical protein